MVIWTNVHLSPELASRLDATAGANDVRRAADLKSSNLAIGSTDAVCRTAHIAFGQPSVDDLLASQSLRWVHLSTAGYTRYDRDDLRAAFAARGAILTTSSAVYDDPCAQHVLSFMLAHNRRLLPSIDEQRGRRSWQYTTLRPAVRTLGGEVVVIVGFGAIAHRLVELLAPLGANVLGVRQRVRGDEPVATHPFQRLPELLASADHVVNLLPSSQANTKLFGQKLFGAFKRGAAFYNVGRGDTVDQESLVAALRSGTVSGAYLDVTDPEPLPPDHPLWSAPNCIITPHTAGGMQDEARQLVDHFSENLRRFEKGQPLLNRVI